MISTHSGGLWRAMIGLVIWMFCFLALYGGHALGCQRAMLLNAVFGLPLLTWLLLLVWLTSLAVLSWLAIRGWSALRVARRERGSPQLSRFMSVLTSTVDIAGLASTVIIGLPLVWIPVCA